VKTKTAMGFNEKLRLVTALAGALVLLSVPTYAGTVSLRWDPVPGATGYKVYYGPSERQYNGVVDVGGTTQKTLTGLPDCATYHLAVKAYNSSGQESGSYSNEVIGLPRPMLESNTPMLAKQGSQLTLRLTGANFDTGAELVLDTDSLPTDVSGNPLVRFESFRVLSCRQIEMFVTVESMQRGFRAMEVGNYSIGYEVRNPDSVFGSASGQLEIAFNPSRSDINRSDESTRDRVDGKDLTWLAYSHGSLEGQDLFNPDADLNGDGQVDGEDLAQLAVDFGSCWTGFGWSATACP
jgi:hypothetical protein